MKTERRMGERVASSDILPRVGGTLQDPVAFET